MPMVFAGACSHSPSITAQAEHVSLETRSNLAQAFEGLRKAMLQARPDAIVIIAAEHFANFFMNNMPAFALGTAADYNGPVEDEGWLKIKPTTVTGHKSLAEFLVPELLQDVDIAYCEEWQLDHGIMVPLHFLTPSYDIPIIPVNINCQHPPFTPLHRCWALGESLRRALDKVPERVAVLATGGISHWPASPETGRINVEWDKEFLGHWSRNDRKALTRYTDNEILRDAGHGGIEIRTFITLAAATKGGLGKVHYYDPVPMFAIAATVATMDIH